MGTNDNIVIVGIWRDVMRRRRFMLLRHFNTCFLRYS